MIDTAKPSHALVVHAEPIFDDDLTAKEDAVRLIFTDGEGRVGYLDLLKGTAQQVVDALARRGYVAHV